MLGEADEQSAVRGPFCCYGTRFGRSVGRCSRVVVVTDVTAGRDSVFFSRRGIDSNSNTVGTSKSSN